MPRKPLDIGPILGAVKVGTLALVLFVPFMVGLMTGFIVKVINLWVAAVIEGYKAGNK